MYSSDGAVGCSTCNLKSFESHPVMGVEPLTWLAKMLGRHHVDDGGLGVKPFALMCTERWDVLRGLSLKNITERGDILRRTGLPYRSRTRRRRQRRRLLGLLVSLYIKDPEPWSSNRGEIWLEPGSFQVILQSREFTWFEI